MRPVPDPERRGPLRLGRGEYFDPRGRHTKSGAYVGTDPQIQAKQLFAWRGIEIAPQILESLWEEVFPIYKLNIKPTETVTWDGPLEATADELEIALVKWASRWNLLAFWILNSALQTMGLWHRRGHFVEFFWTPAAVGVGLTTWKLELIDWDPLQMTRKAWEGMLRSKFEALLEERGDSIDGRAKASFEETPLKYAMKGEDPWRHFDWLIRCRVLGESASQVGEDYPVKERAIRAAVRKLSSELDLSV